MNGWENCHERKLHFHLDLTPAGHGPRVEGRAVSDEREDAVEPLAGAWASAQERLEAGVGGGARRPWARPHEPLGRSGQWCMGGCFSRMRTEVSGRGAGQTASVVGQPRPRTSGRARRSAPAGGSLLLGGKRSPSVSSRCTNQYSVMTGLESGPSSRSVTRFRDPSSHRARRGPDEGPPSAGVGATCSARSHPAHRRDIFVVARALTAVSGRGAGQTASVGGPRPDPRPQGMLAPFRPLGERGNLGRPRCGNGPASRLQVLRAEFGTSRPRLSAPPAS